MSFPMMTPPIEISTEDSVHEPFCFVAYLRPGQELCSASSPKLSAFAPPTTASA